MINFINESSIEGINPKYLKIVEYTDYIETGKKRWFIKNNVGATTPIFNNVMNIITISDKSCMFLGNHNGSINLFIIDGSKDKDNLKFYDELELEGYPKKLINVDSKSLIVKSEKGFYFFDKESLTRKSEMFDEIIVNIINDKEIYTFEKKLRNNDNEIINTIIGNISLDGKIGDFIYDESVNCIRSTPKLNINDSYDELNYQILYDEFDKISKEKEKSKTEFVKKLSRINRNVTKY